MRKGSRETGNPAKIRQLNRRAILDYMRSEQASSRSELVKILNLAPATVSAIVADLVREALLIETGQMHENKKSPGRPSREIKLNPSAAYVVGIVLRIELGVLFLDISWSDYSGKVVIERAVRISDKNDLSLIVENINTEINQLYPKLEQENIISLCIGLPGVANGSEIVFCPNIPSILGPDFHQMLCQRLLMPVYFENDVNLAVLSELNQRPALQHINFSYLFISQGVGAGTALQGELWKSSGWAGEIGQLDANFDGQFKKIEWILGMGGFASQFESILGMSIQSAFATLEHKTENSLAHQMVNTYVDYLFMAIQVLNSAFDLDEVIIGENTEDIIRYCLPSLKHKINKSTLKVTLSHRENTALSSARGASILALQNSLNNIEVLQPTLISV